ncbi:unnamed protein product [Allacma fusca]|uniref:Uncharacterized protein n=1 Tax=Allacma fusca TaxID=39272 RepID=A0A8J2PN22_9HEXA|nr:unnamed protein product [Allacma fusca]
MTFNYHSICDCSIEKPFVKCKKKMKPEIGCFNPGGCMECVFGGKLYIKTETGLVCCIKNPSKLDVNIAEVISRAADCPEPEKSDNLLFHLAVGLACSLLLTIAGWLAYCWR